MDKLKCLNCGNEQCVTDKDICYDELGPFVTCEECGSAYDITLKEEGVKMNYMVCWNVGSKNDWKIISGEDEMQVFVNELIEEYGLDKDENVTVFDLNDELDKSIRVRTKR